MTRPVLHVLGCGRAARSVARWLHEAGQVDIGLIVNRRLESARQAVKFLGAGQAAPALDERIQDGWLLIGVPDGELGQVVAELAEQMPARPMLSWHLSGAMPGKMLAALGPSWCSVHPVCAFADPLKAVRQLNGSWFVAEGTQAALAPLHEVHLAAGARWLVLAEENKALYHAATVTASNYLVAITALAREMAESAGIPVGEAADLLASLQSGTLSNLVDCSAAEALTGPVERADLVACQRLVEGVGAAMSTRQLDLFCRLGLATLALARRGRGDRPEDVAIEALFTTHSS